MMTQKFSGIFLVCTFLVIVFLVFITRKKLQNHSNLVYKIGKIQTNLPKKTNSWFSSAYAFPSDPIFALPGAYKISEDGIGISLPNVRTQEKLISAGYTPLCSINRGSLIKKSSVETYHDWDVTLKLTDEQSDWNVQLIQGAPTLRVLKAGQMISVSCTGKIEQLDDGAILFTSAAQQYLFEANSGHSKIIDSTHFTLSSDNGEYRASVLPDNGKETLQTFTHQSWDHVEETHVEWNLESTQLSTLYTIATQHQQPILTTLWPHHIPYLAQTYAPVSHYKTVLGDFTLVNTSSFATKTSAPELPVNFIAVHDPARRSEIMKQIQVDAQEFLQHSIPVPEGVYFRGTWVGSIITLIQLADVYGMNRERDALISVLQPVLAESLSNLNYDEAKRMLIAKNMEFGNENGNDHHFHYGYYIRAASVILQYKPELFSSLQPKVDAMIQDIANQDRDTAKYPFLRSYSVYEGHSWADGAAHFADGNNQESTSEALNAWYAVSLWGRVTKNASLQTLGSWLFSQELSGTQAYWFGKENPFPDGYAHSVASLVWGGKREFATWFSPDPVHVQGIQWLPITPASLYLKDLPNSTTRMSELEKIGEPLFSNEWADLFVATLSYTNPQKALKYNEKVQHFSGIKLQSLFKQVVYSNSEQH